MIRLVAVCCVLGSLALSPVVARAQEPNEEAAAKLEALTAEVDRLRAEVDSLRTENATLRERLAAATSATRPATTRPATTRPTTDVVTRYDLGETTQLGSYQFRTPVGWTAGPRDEKLQVLFRSPDKLAVVLMRIKLKGAAPPEAQPKYAQNVIQMLKLDFVKNKAEVIDPPVAVPDPRFYLRVRERIRLKGEKTADQTHFYAMPGKDMVELNVITTSDQPDQVARTVRMAEEMMLSLKAVK
jgi:outer membrane murein-binding lipoprotein Lpp